MTTHSEVWQRGQRLAVVASPDRVVVLRLDALAEPPVIMVGSAAAVWSAIDGTRSTREIVRRVAEDFDARPAAISDQVAAFLAGLAARDLARVDR